MEKRVYNVKVVIALPNRIRSNEQPTQIKEWLRLAELASHANLYYFYLRGLRARTPARRTGDVADKPSLETEP